MTFVDKIKEMKENQAIVKVLEEPKLAFFELRPQLQWRLLQQGAVAMPWLPIRLRDQEEMVRRSTTLRTCIIVLRSELTRKGIEIEPNFWAKCDNPDCAIEFEEKPSELFTTKPKELKLGKIKCPECEVGSLIPPDKSEKQRLMNFMPSVNANDQSLTDVVEELEDDLNTYDNQYLLFNKDYYFDNRVNEETGKKEKVLMSELREILRLNPQNTFKSINLKGEIGREYVTCLYHRQVLLKIPTAENDHYGVINQALECPICKSKDLYAVYYVSSYNNNNSGFGNNSKDYTKAYIKGEVVYNNRYYKSIFYGVSLILTTWHHAIADIDMTKYIADYYRERKIPRGVLVLPGSRDSVKKTEKEWTNMLQQDNQSIPIMGIGAGKDVTGKAEFISFVNTLEEMQFSDVQEKWQKQIAKPFGVSPLFMLDTSASGGLNNEGHQITVTNRAIERNISTYNKTGHVPGLFQDITDALNIKDWKLVLPPPEEKDRMAGLQRKQTKLIVAQTAFNGGLTVELPPEGLTDQNDFKISGQFVKEEPSFGSFGQENTNPKEPQEPSNDGAPEKPPAASPKSYDLIKARPLDIITNELLDLMHRVFSTTLGTVFLSQFEGRDTDSLTEEELLTAALTASRVITEGYTNLGQSFAQATFALGAMVAEEDPAHPIEPNIHFSMSLRLGAEADTMAIAAYNDSMMNQAFETFNVTISNDFRQIIRDNFDAGTRKTIPQLVSDMDKVVNTETWRLERIARSESTRFANEGRVMSYRENDPAGKHKFYWSVHEDHRLSDVCHTIFLRVNREGLGLGVSLDHLYNILVEEQRNLMGRTWIPGWLVHPNCRSRPVRIVIPLDQIKSAELEKCGCGNVKGSCPRCDFVL